MDPVINRFGMTNRRENYLERDIGISIRIIPSSNEIVIRSVFDKTVYLCRDADDLVFNLLDLIEKFKKVNKCKNITVLEG